MDTKDASGTIRFATWTGNPEEDKALKMMIAEFEKANPKIKVEYAPLTGDYNQVLTTQMSGGQGPDVFYYDAYTAGQYIEDDYLEPIEGYDLTDFYPAMVAPFVKDGKTYGIPKDFSTLEEKMNLALSKLKRNTNYEAPTTCLNIAWAGGYDSAQMLNAKRTLCLEMGLASCTFTDSVDTDHSLTLEQAKEVCIAVAAEFETRRAIYKMKKRTIELCATIEELEAIEI